MSDISRNHYIAGKWIKGQGKQFTSESPSTEQVIWTGYNATNQNIDDAILAASEAFPKWTKLGPVQRIKYLKLFVDILKENKEELSNIIAEEIGKPLWEAETEVGAMIGKLDPSLQAYSERANESTREQPNGICRTRYLPHGVVIVLGPYNFPGHMPNGQIIPALLAGNTVVFKPSEKAPASSEKIMEYWDQAGLPSGVLNFLQGGVSVGKHLCQHKNVNGVFFTGSKKAGESIRSSLTVDKICVLEMGGNSPLIVWDASNIDVAVIATIHSVFITAGQRCSSARRLIIPQNEFGKLFLSRLIDLTEQLRIGRHDDDPKPYMGPLRYPRMVDDILEEQDELIKNGAIPLLTSRRLEIGKSFISPGIIDVTSAKQRKDAEILGPFLQVIRVDNFDEAIDEANNTNYGLAAGIFTESRELYEQFVSTVRAGIVNWNQQLTGASPWAPFGGIKNSGNFQPSGFLAIDFCVYATGSMELEELPTPKTLPPGISI